MSTKIALQPHDKSQATTTTHIRKQSYIRSKNRKGHGAVLDALPGSLCHQAPLHDSRPTSVDRERRRRETSSLEGEHQRGGLHATNDDERGLLMVPSSTKRPLGGDDAGSVAASAMTADGRVTKIEGSTNASSKSGVSASSSVAALDGGGAAPSSKDKDYVEEVIIFWLALHTLGGSGVSFFLCRDVLVGLSLANG